MELLARLEATRDRTLAYFDLEPEALARTYAPGKWSVLFVLHHLADAETVLYERIRRIAAEPRNVVWAFDQDAWARAHDYERAPLAVSKDLYRALRAGVIYCAQTYLPDLAERTFVHSELGLRTLGQEVEKVASHNEHHLAQIEQALARP